MHISLEQIGEALKALGVKDEHLRLAIAELQELLTDLDEVEVKGRQKVDTLLGCMMAVENIIGKEQEEDG